jgi:hypothetical protein
VPPLNETVALTERDPVMGNDGTGRFGVPGVRDSGRIAPAASGAVGVTGSAGQTRCHRAGTLGGSQPVIDVCG